MDIESLYPDRDPWLYQATTDEDWDDERPVPLGRRTDTRMRLGRLSNTLACWKADNDGYEAFTEKVCSDFAQILRIGVPAGVIALDAKGYPCFLSKAPYRDSKIMKLIRGDHSRHAADPMRLHAYAQFYRTETVAFDLWVDNWDKHAGNLIWSLSAREIASIDYGWVFGLGYGQPARWMGDGCEACLRACLPLPGFVSPANIDGDRAIQAAESIAALPDNLIQYVVKRACAPYARASVELFAEEVTDGLLRRRRKVSEWLRQYLPTRSSGVN